MNALILAAALAGAAEALRSRKVSISMGTEFGGSLNNLVNAASQLTPFMVASNWSQAAPLDANGWPLTDFETHYDCRPAPQWLGYCDDPACEPEFCAGDWLFVFGGNVTVGTGGDPGNSASVVNSTFDSTAWTTTVWVNLANPPAQQLMMLNVTNTQRTSTSGFNSGVSSIVAIRPGYANTQNQVYVDELQEALTPFDHVRFMGVTGTNTFPGYYGDVGHHLLSWNDRCLPSDAIWGDQNLRPGCWGMPWENIVNLAQQTGKGIWINMPVSATIDVPSNTSTYVNQWAQLFKNGNAETNNKGVPAGVPIYIEHSNEVWNYGFGQYVYNKLAAMDDCNVTINAQGCLWNNDGSTDADVWAQRRHLYQVFLIKENFVSVFGPDSFGSIVRPIYAEWTIFPNRYNDTLNWFNKTVGNPSDHIFGMAMATYFGGKPVANQSIADWCAAYLNDTHNQIALRQELVNVANYWGIKLTAYEGGPGWDVGTTTNLANVIMAQHDPCLGEAVINDITSYATLGGWSYNYFTVAGLWSRYGQWGSMPDFHDMANPSTIPKFCALLEVTGNPVLPGCYNAE